MAIRAFDRIKQKVLSDIAVSGIYWNTSGSGFAVRSGYSGYMDEAINTAMISVACYCNFTEFPDFTGPYYQTGPNPKVSGLTGPSGSFYFKTDETNRYKVSFTTSGVTDGIALASGIQSGINNAVSTINEDYYIFKNVVVEYDSNPNDASGFYLSGDPLYYSGFSGYNFLRFSLPVGYDQRIYIEDDGTDYETVVQLKLEEEYGANFVQLIKQNNDLEQVAANIAKRLFKQRGAEGGVNSKTIGKLSISYGNVSDPNALNTLEKHILANYRKLRI